MLLLLGMPPVLAQPAPTYWVHPDYTVRQWTVEDGLPSTEFRDLLETEDGYIWIATHEGLVRFDGWNFTVFNATNTPGLGTVITELSAEPGDSLWIASRRDRLTIYHQGRFSPVDIPERIPRPLLQEGAITWVGTTSGLVRFEDDQPSPYRRDLINTEVQQAVRDPERGLWIRTRDQGLFLLDTRSEDSPARQFTTADGLPSMSIGNVFIDRDGILWVAAQGGVVRMVGNRFVPVQRSFGKGLSGDTVGNDGIPLIQYQDEAGGVWITSPREGWWRYEDTHTGTLLPSSSYTVIARSIKPGPDGVPWRLETATAVARQEGQEDVIYQGDEPVFRIRDEIVQMEFDSSGYLWITTEVGLFHLRPASLHTLNQVGDQPLGSIYVVLQDQQGRVVAGTRTGTIARYDAALQPTLISIGQAIFSMYEDRSGNLWVGNRSVCQVREGRCQSVGFPPPIQETFNQFALNVHAMLEDLQGRFWVVGKHGVLQGQSESETYAWTAIKGSSGLPVQWVVGILETSDGTLLFPTNGDGLLRYDDEKGDFEALTTEHGLPDNIVHTLYEDQAGLIWLGVGGQGLCRLDRRGRRTLAEADLACIDSQHGLYWNTIFSILEDHQGRFWFNTTNGIFWVERAALEAYFAGELETVSSVSYTEADGMLSRRGLGRVNSAGVRLASGQLWFPNWDGVVVIDPETVSQPAPPRILVETVRVGEEERPAQGRVALSADERDIEIRYTAPEFVHPEDVRFQYKLEGYDAAWHDGGRERFATYTNLAPGTYEFQVRAALGGSWGNVARLTIERAPHFWQTMWFLAVIGILFVLAGSSVYVLRVRHLKANEAALERIVAVRTREVVEQAKELRKANDLKSRFLANISHEFRTPLTLTFGPLDDALQGRFGSFSEARPHFERARRNGGRLLRLINQLLDLSKLDAGALLLHASRHDLAAHLRQLAALFHSMAQNRQIRFTTHLPDEPQHHVYDADKIEKVVINLLSNAFKFTQPGGKISLSLAQEADGMVQIEVADTGPGIAEEYVPHLFDRFYQVESTSTRTHEGTGIGLALVKELVALHEGEIAVESKVGFGTRFTIQLPVLEAAEVEEAESANGAAAESVVAVTGAVEEISGSLARPVAGPEDVSLIYEGDGAPDAETVVLVVEDNGDMRAYIRSHLEDLVIVIEAENGRVGLEQAVEVVPDLILSDVMMPEMDGLELCQAVKADERTSHIPVILLTARAQVEDRIAGFTSGADAYLPKPFNAEELQVRVQTLIEERRRLRSLFRGAGPHERSGEDSVLTSLPPGEAAFLEKLYALIEESYSDPQFGAEALAEGVHMSLRQLHRKLRALTDETPAALIRRLRMERAAVLLASGEMAVKEVAYSVGYRSNSNFSRLFQKIYGVSPSEYAGPSSSPMQGTPQG